MVLTQKQQEIVLSIDGKTSIAKVQKNIKGCKPYIGFLMGSLVELGFITRNKEDRLNQFQLTDKGEQLKAILKNTPKISHVNQHVIGMDWLKSAHKPNKM